MISLSERLGSNSFYSYVEKFGYFEKTGIDLPSEARTIFHKEEALGTTELATASFGQRFKVTVISQLTAIAAVANGGRLVTPYVVERIVDANGNTVKAHETEIKRQVISEDVAKTVSEILIDGVNGDGGAKNAGVSGYDIAAKTGTSQKFDILDENGNSYLRIGSTVAYSTDADSGIAMIIVVDEPTTSVKYGSVVAAPYVSALMEKVLPYLEYASNIEEYSYTVKNYVGMNIESAKNKLSGDKISYEIMGGGSVVISQSPAAGDTVNYALSKILLYTEEVSDELAEVPSLVGMKLSDAIKLAASRGFNIKLSGISASSASGTDIICEQSLTVGEKVRRGTLITIRAIKTDYYD